MKVTGSFKNGENGLPNIMKDVEMHKNKEQVWTGENDFSLDYPFNNHKIISINECFRIKSIAFQNSFKSLLAHSYRYFHLCLSSLGKEHVLAHHNQF